MSDDDIEGRLGDISGRLGDISGRLGDISGGPFEPVRRMVFEGRLIDELNFLTAKLKRLEKDLMQITMSLDTRLHNLEERFREGPGPGQPRT